MSFSYDCNFLTQATRLTPVAKRQGVRLGFLECISDPIQWNRDNFFDYYINGNNPDEWDVLTAYVKYDRVKHQNKIYECISDVTGELPTNEDYWILAVNDFRGVTERIKYNCQKIMLEWVLNKWFGTNFEQPQNPPVNSDFYIISNDRDGNIFYTSEFSTLNGVYQPSSVPQFSAGMEDYIGETSDATFSANFTVFYPLTEIPLITDDKYYQMVDLMNKYKIAGSTVEYVSY